MRAAPQKNGPAEAATSPSRGPLNSRQENEVNVATDTTAPACASSTGARRRVEQLIDELQQALLDLDEGAIRAIVTSDQLPVLQHLDGVPIIDGRPFVGVPKQLWRRSMMGPQLPAPEIDFL